MTVQPAAKKRGADTHVPVKGKRLHSVASAEQKLEQGLEESMAGWSSECQSARAVGRGQAHDSDKK